MSIGMPDMSSKRARRGAAVLGAAALLALAGAAPAKADFCVRLTGGSFSGDIGYFRFDGKVPSDPGAMVTLAGRGAGLYPVFGSAVVAKDGSYVEIGATFFIDAVQGQFDITLGLPGGTDGSGYGSYGVYDVNDSVSVKRVSCSTEP